MPNLLIVDDEYESRFSLREFIKSSEFNYFTVYEADEYEKGLLMLKKLKPSILIVEISLPDHNGLELGEIAKQWDPGVSVIILTQLKVFEDVQKAINLGFSAFLLKPVLKSEIQQIFERIIIQSLSTETKYFMDKSEGPPDTDFANPIESSIQFIQKHFKEPITLNMVADAVYLSPTHFSRLFKEEMGTTFIEYLSSYRVEQSKSLLKMTSIPIEVIAHQTGFASAGYFATTFRKYEGCTPSKYRSLFSKE